MSIFLPVAYAARAQAFCHPAAAAFIIADSASLYQIAYNLKSAIAHQSSLSIGANKTKILMIKTSCHIDSPSIFGVLHLLGWMLSD
jgi:hypothetical protein